MGLLDNAKLISQFINLERRARAGGRDQIDHPPGGHDDLANAVAGAVVASNTPRVSNFNRPLQAPALGIV